MSPPASLIVVALFALSLGPIDPALAQTASAATVPTPSCEKPGDPPSLVTTGAGREMAERKQKEWGNRMKTYVECLKRFIDDEQAVAASHAKAVQAAIEEYNNAIKTYNDQAQAARP